MFEIINLESTKTSRGAPLFKFDVRFTLSDNFGSMISYAWRYDPENNKLFWPSAPGSHARMSSTTDDIKKAIKRQVHRMIVYRQADIEVATIATKLRDILAQATPREAYEELRGNMDEEEFAKLSPNQWVIIMTLGVLSDYLNLLPAPNPEISMEDD